LEKKEIKNIKGKKILVLPRWYPNQLDIQLGIFIQRQLVLMREQHDFYVVYTQAIEDLPSKFQHKSNETLGFPEHVVYFRSAKGPFRKITNFYRYKKAQEMGLKFCPKNIDACHIHVPYRSALPALKLNRKKGIPFAITEHWSGHINGAFSRKNSFDKWLYKRIVQKASVISTVSQKLKDAFQYNTGKTSVVIPNYIEQGQKNGVIHNDAKIKLLSIGDIHDATKNFSGLLKAYRAALTEMNNMHLTIVGDGPDRDEIHHLAKLLNFPPNTIHFTGRLEHQIVLETIQDCDFYICNSNFETFGMTVAEALFAGKPVISTTCGGPEEFVNTNNGILIEISENSTNLKEAIIKMSGVYKSFKKEDLINPIADRFGKETVKKAWSAFYDKLLINTKHSN